MTTDWNLKINAYLHDPPDKPFALGIRGGHERWGRELAKLVAEPEKADWDLIHRADRLASGADRATLLPDVPPSLRDLRHPLSGEIIDLSAGGELTPEVLEQAREALRQEVKALAIPEGPDARFVALWALLTPRLRGRTGDRELGPLWEWLPADTRMPSHSLVLHQALTSSLATVLASGSDPALLSFSIGPVQSFIAQARRTSDLWAGSHLLGEALLNALAPLVEEFGPDHVIFPALRRSGRFLHWLARESRWRQALEPIAASFPEETGASGLPNRFLAVVPSAEAARIAGECEKAMRSFWGALVQTHARDLEGRDPRLTGFATMALGQAEAAFQVTWASSPWPASAMVRPDDEAVRLATWARGGPGPSTKAFLEEGAKQRSERIAYRPNGGALYGEAYASVESLAAAVKRTRPIPMRAEGGLKCSLCGERAVVPGQAKFEEQKAIWSDLRRDAAGDLRRGEALCGVCWARRRVGRLEASQVPSTAEIAASPFKAALLAKSGQLRSSIDALHEAAVQQGDLARGWAVPAVARAAKGHKLLRIDGEALLGVLREADEPAEADLDRKVLAACRRLRRESDRLGIRPPRPYLGALAFDGDHMGRWLSGAKNRALRKYLSRDAVNALSEIPQALPFLDLQWPMTPALHAAISEACAVFSQRSAARTLHEEDLPGFLVYAGGDDVLALVPIGCSSSSDPTEIATEAALRLRFRFSGSVCRADGTAAFGSAPLGRNGKAAGDRADPASRAGVVIDPREGLGLAMGATATASAGLAVFHQRWPLGRALREARAAEVQAKDAMGRDALAIALLRRSGQITHTGLKFVVNNGSPVRALQRVAHAFAFDALSPKFVSEISARLGPLQDAGLRPGELLDLARPLVRQAARAHFNPGNPADISQESILQSIDELETGSRASGGVEPNAGQWGRVGPDRAHLDRWIALLEAAAFLGRGVEP